MIERLRIKNFKSHKDTNLLLRPLTVLTGLNGSGKTSLFSLCCCLDKPF